MPSFEFEEVDHLTFATLGEPGNRVFLFQAGFEDRLMTLKLEKEQVRTICSYISELLGDLSRPGHLPDDLELRQPADIAWVIGPIAVLVDEETEKFILTFESFNLPESDVIEAPDFARVVATKEQAASLIIHGTTLVESGRPPCPLCGYPLDPSGHACPRTNGNRPPKL